MVNTTGLMTAGLTTSHAKMPTVNNPSPTAEELAQLCALETQYQQIVKENLDLEKCILEICRSSEPVGQEAPFMNGVIQTFAGQLSSSMKAGCLEANKLATNEVIIAQLQSLGWGAMESGIPASKFATKFATTTEEKSTDGDEKSPDEPEPAAGAAKGRRRHNVNGSTRTKRRRERARQEAAEEAARALAEEAADLTKKGEPMFAKMEEPMFAKMGEPMYAKMGEPMFAKMDEPIMAC